MKVFNEKNYKRVLGPEDTNIIVFTSKFCHLCVKLKPILKKLEKKYEDVNFYVCDINKSEKMAKLILKDEGVPTGFVTKDDKT